MRKGTVFYERGPIAGSQEAERQTEHFLMRRNECILIIA